jgi:predicted metal-dependent HD superfamily phosphohydrolase
VNRLATAWSRLIDGGATQASQRALRRLSRAYREPHRAYHNLDHIADVVCRLGRSPSKALLAAALFHDAVYDPRRSDNEERSAQVMRHALKPLGISARMLDRAAELIMVTKSHRIRRGDREASLLIDADLATLAARPDRYDAYAHAIRGEYSWVPADAYRDGRARVLRSFLDRPRLYRTAAMRRRELAARLNLTREIASLRS